MLSAAVEWGSLPVNPASRIRLPAAPPKVQAVQRVLTADQAVKIVAHAKTPRNETLIRAASTVGLRRGEIVGLKWPDVLLEKRRVVVRRSAGKARRTRSTFGCRRPAASGAAQSRQRSPRASRTGTPRASSMVAPMRTATSGPGSTVERSTAAPLLASSSAPASAPAWWTRRRRRSSRPTDSATPEGCHYSDSGSGGHSLVVVDESSDPVEALHRADNEPRAWVGWFEAEPAVGDNGSSYPRPSWP